MPDVRPWMILGLLATSLLMAGCGGEEPIRKYEVPHVEPAKIARGKESDQRLLAAIFPQPDKNWFFKVSGADEAVVEIKDAFDGFVKSVRFTGKKESPVDWKVPPGWVEIPGAGAVGLRFTSFAIPTKTEKLDLSISSSGGSLLDNVNRWQGQLGLRKLTEAGLKDVTREIEVAGVKVTLVELGGVKADPNKGGNP